MKIMKHIISSDENHEKGLRQQKGRFWNVIVFLQFKRHALKNADHEEKFVDVYKVCASL